MFEGLGGTLGLQQQSAVAAGLLQQQQMQSQHAFYQQALAQTGQYFPQLEAVKKKEAKKMSMVREYINKHRDVIFTLGVALLVDHFILNGALRHRIQRVIEAALAKIEKAFGVEPEVKDVTV